MSREFQTPPNHPSINRSETQRATGCMVGAAVGDALGAPFEFRGPNEYAMAFPRPALGGTGEMIGGGSFGWAPGEFTDDTQMAIALAHALLDAGRWDADTVWNWFRAWAATANDVGVTTATALAHADWRAVPKGGKSGAGNGALMRAFPLAVAYLFADADTARSVVVEQAALTHPDPAAGWGAWIAVELCRLAIRGEDPFAYLDTIVGELPDDVRGRFAEMLSPQWTPDLPHVTNGSVWGCLAEAVWAVRNTSNFHDAVVAAINLGGDTDTVACVAGALAGALYGVQAIPSRWTTYLNGNLDTPSGSPLRMRTADLLALTRRLLGLGEPSEEPAEYTVEPKEVAPGLYACNYPGAAGVPTDWAVVVHCHGGRSRTGLVLKAWKMRAHGASEREAHDWLADQWPLYEDYNRTFVEFLRTDW